MPCASQNDLNMRTASSARARAAEPSLFPPGDAFSQADPPADFVGYLEDPIPREPCDHEPGGVGTEIDDGDAVIKWREGIQYDLRLRGSQGASRRVPT